MLGRILRVVQALFGLAALLGRGRATHKRGIGAAGVLTVVDRPPEPANAFFAPGRRFPVRLRHANLESADDAAMDIRGASLKLADTAEDAPLDLVMNTGEASLFRDPWVFLDFVRARPRGAAGFRWMAEKWPREWAAGAAGWRIGPRSYATLRYHSQIVMRWRSVDGTVWWVRYRLIPGADAPEDGIPEPERLEHPISLDRRAEDARPTDALRREFRDRVLAGPVLYRLQVQLHRPSATDPPEILDSSRAWDLPWQDLAYVALDRPLCDKETEALRFNVARQPASLGLLEPTSAEDYNAIGWLRARVYPVSQLLRTWRRSAPVIVERDADRTEILTPETLAELYRRLPDDARAEITALVRTRTPGEAPSPEVHGTWRAVGRVLHDDPGADGHDRPARRLVVELWDRDPIGPDDLLGRAETGPDGRFEIPYDPADAGPEAPDLELRVIDPVSGRVVGVAVGADDVRHTPYAFGEVRVRHWEYAPGPLPRLFVPSTEDPPQDFAPGRRPMLLRNLARCAAQRAHHLFATRADPHALSLDDVQAAYPVTPPVEREREAPGSTRSDAYFVDRMLNGFYPAPFAIDGDVWSVAYRFDADEHNGRYDLPNAEATFRRVGGTLVPTSITVAHRLPDGLAPGSPYGEPVTVTPADGDRWAAAKRVFTSAHLVAGEVDGHLCRAHLDVEQFAIACFRNLRRSPLLPVLAPHLKEVTTINWQGAAWVYGDSGIVPRISGLTPRAVGARFVDQMGRVDWYGFAPPASIGRDHRWANVANRYWNLLGDYLDDVLYRERDAIAATWDEVAAFSRDLSHRSAPFTGVDPDGPKGAPPRVTHGGVLRAVRPITWTDTPSHEDWARLRDACRYAIFRATLWHSWINDKQLEDGGDVRIGTLGLRNGGFGDDRTVGALPVDASEQLYLVGVLVGTAYGFVVKNEDGDVPAQLIERLMAQRNGFVADGLDVTAIRSRVNI